MDNNPQPDQPEARRYSSNDTRLSSLVLDESHDGEPHEPGFAYIDGEVGGSPYNDTKVDVVAVPCPGADPLRPWMGSEPFPDGYFSIPYAKVALDMYPALKELAGDAILSPGINMNLPKAAHVWVRQGIRKSASTARVLLYRHRTLSEGVTIESLADDLIVQVLKVRERDKVVCRPHPQGQSYSNTGSIHLVPYSSWHIASEDWSSRNFCRRPASWLRINRGGQSSITATEWLSLVTSTL